MAQDFTRYAIYKAQLEQHQLHLLVAGDSNDAVIGIRICNIITSTAI